MEDLTNYTPRAHQAMAFARKEAERRNHAYIDTEHLLAGILSLKQGTGFTVLQKMGVTLERVREVAGKIVPDGPALQTEVVNGPFSYNRSLKRVQALAYGEKTNLDHTYVGTEHLLLGLLREDEGVASKILKEMGVDIETVREEILKELNPERQPVQKDKRGLEEAFQDALLDARKRLSSTVTFVQGDGVSPAARCTLQNATSISVTILNEDVMVTPRVAAFLLVAQKYAGDAEQAEELLRRLLTDVQLMEK